MPDETAETVPVPYVAGSDYAAHCLVCEVGWAQSEGMTCWWCGGLGELGVIPASLTVMTKQQRDAEEASLRARFPRLEALPWQVQRSS